MPDPIPPRWWFGYFLLIAVAVLGVSLISGSVVAGALAGVCVVLSATWTAARYYRPSHNTGPGS